jgi:hypothetical protein
LIDGPPAITASMLNTGSACMATGELMLAVIGAVGRAEWEAMLRRPRVGIAKL